MEVRALGVGLPYALANAAFGGSAEYVALWCKSIGREESSWYVTIVSALTLLVADAELRRHGSGNRTCRQGSPG